MKLLSTVRTTALKDYYQSKLAITTNWIEVEAILYMSSLLNLYSTEISNKALNNKNSNTQD